MSEPIKMFQTLDSNSINNLANYPKGEPVICFEKVHTHVSINIL